MMIEKVIITKKIRYSGVLIRNATQKEKIKSIGEFNIFVENTLINYGLDTIIITKLPSFGILLENKDIFYSNNDINLSVYKLIDFSNWHIFSPLTNSFMPYYFITEIEAIRAEKLGWEYHEFTEHRDTLERIFLTQTRALSGCCIPFLMPRKGKALAIFSSSTEVVMPSLGDLFLVVMEMAEYLANPSSPSASPDRHELTLREVECLRWVAAGKTSSEIANITSLSEHTVNHYLQVCCKKLDAVNRIQAAVTATKMELI